VSLLYNSDTILFKTITLSIVPIGSSSQESLSSREQISCYICSVEKNNLTEKKTKRFNLIHNAYLCIFVPALSPFNCS
jgi:hypothetical protein